MHPLCKDPGGCIYGYAQDVKGQSNRSFLPKRDFIIVIDGSLENVKSPHDEDELVVHGLDWGHVVLDLLGPDDERRHRCDRPVVSRKRRKRVGGK